MRRVFVIVFFVFTSLLSALAQDIITYKTGQELKAQIIRLNPQDVTFVTENSTDTLSLMREELAKLQYRNGTIIYLSEKQNPSVIEGPVNDSMFVAGTKDALIYYRGYKAAATGTLICSIYFPWGLIPAIACSSTPPLMTSLGYKDQKLMQNPSYYDGYTKQAYKIKKKKVWQSFAIGSGAVIALSILISVAAISAY